MNLTSLMASRRPIKTVEFLPPKGPSLRELVEKAHKLSKLVDAINISDVKLTGEPAIRFRMLPFYAALRLKQLASLEVVCNLTLRDMNKSALMGTIIACIEAGLDNLLVVRGDPYSPEEANTSSNVYDYKSTVEFIREIRWLEKNLPKPAGKVCLIAGANPTAIYRKSAQLVEREIEVLLKKQDAGADMIQTQPVFDERYFEFLDRARERGLRIPVIAGIIPLRDYNDCLEIEKRFGIAIPEPVKVRMKGKGEAEGIGIAQEVYQTLIKGGAEGVHIYPRERPEWVIRILEGST